METNKELRLILGMISVSIFLAGTAVFAANTIITNKKTEVETKKEVKEVAKETKLEEEVEKKTETETSKNEKKEELKPEFKFDFELEEDETVVSEESTASVAKEESTASVVKEESTISTKNEETKETKETKIKGTVEGAQEVEYSLVKKGSVEPQIYLGSGIVENQAEENEWSLDYDFSNVPQGQYEIYAEVKNKYGTYLAGVTSLEITDKEQGDIQTSISEQLKTLENDKLVVENNSSLSEEQKQEKLKEIEQKKAELKGQFTFRKQIEKLFGKEESDLTNEELKAFQEIKDVLKIDSDGDGLPDYEEDRIGSNPFSADSDQDGYLDGDEVRNGYDPIATSTELGVDKIVFEEPKTSGEENSFYQISKIEIKEGDENLGKKAGVKMSGRALPNSFITLYIYSDPVVVTVKTDEDGNWSYELDKELEDGNHEIYAAVTDNTGKITSKSKAFAFVKTAQAVTPLNQMNNNLEQTQSPIEQRVTGVMTFVAITSLLSLIIAIGSIVLLFKNYKNNINN